MAARLVLASSSPRRRALLAQLGIDLQIVSPQVDEADLPGEPPDEFVLRVSKKKGVAVAASHPGQVVLAADTAVVLGPMLLGKPRGAEDAVRMLLQLSGREHQVLTGVWAGGPGGEHHLAVSTSVRFRRLSEAEARWYVATGEPMDKAGAYAIQERGGMFVERIDGSYSNVVGLPIVESLALLTRAGLALPWEGS
jgi:septum formation protein